jgi:hypothetical protein
MITASPLVRRPARPLSQRSPLFSDTEFPKDHIQDLLDINSSSESPETHQGMAQILCHELFSYQVLASALFRPSDRFPQSGCHLTQLGPLPLTRHEGGLEMPKALMRKTHQSCDQFLDAHPGRC